MIKDIMMMLLFAVFCYLVGSISPSILISKGIYRKDVRTLGSGNAGTTNMLRNFGKTAALATLVIDALKGVPGVILGTLFFGADIGIWFGMAAIIGHIWPIQFGFKGGKGVATIVGCSLAAVPTPALICILIGIVLIVIFRRVSVAALIAVALLPVFAWSLSGSMNLCCWSLACTAIVWFTHRENIKRIFKGEEPKLQFKKQEKP